MKDKTNFSHDDSRDVLIAMGLVSSSGAVGEEARRRSTREDRTRDPLFNQLKMYSELFRMLGWIHPGTDRTHFNFSVLGKYIGNPENDVNHLVEECILGIVFPNPNFDTVSGNSIRPFPFLLKTMEASNGIIFRDEIIISVLSVSDDNDEEFTNSISKIEQVRGSYPRLMTTLSQTIGRIQINTARNYTRIPLGILRYANWAEQVSNRTIYKKMLIGYKLSQKGQILVAELANRVDIRNPELSKYSIEKRANFNLLAHLTMLERSGWDLVSYQNLFNRLSENCASILEDFEITNRQQILYSPYQQSTSEELLAMEELDAKYEAEGL